MWRRRELEQQQGEAFRLSGWSDYDVLDVSAVLDSLQQTEKPEPDVVRQLVDHGILEEPHG